VTYQALLDIATKLKPKSTLKIMQKVRGLLTAQRLQEESKMKFDIEVEAGTPYSRSLYGTARRGLVFDIDMDMVVLYEVGDFKLFKPVTPDWKQTTFVSGPPTPPDDAKRAKLRAKRKK
jgi:hypothetical protein